MSEPDAMLSIARAGLAGRDAGGAMRALIDEVMRHEQVGTQDCRGWICAANEAIRFGWWHDGHLAIILIARRLGGSTEVKWR